MKVRFEDRLQNELQRTLDHSVADRGNREHPESPSGLRHSHAPHPLGPVRAGYQLLAQLLEELRAPRTFHGFERHPIHSRGPVVLLGKLVRGLQRLHLVDVHVQPPETP